jgi:predicted small metal-binding protein
MALEFACARVGVLDCGASVSAETKEELLAIVAEHARTAHGVELNATLIDYALTEVRQA